LLGKQFKYWRSLRKARAGALGLTALGVQALGVRVDASYRLLYDELGKGA